MICVGIDPGLDGGLAAISPEGLELAVMPTVPVGKGRQIDEQSVVSFLTSIRPGVVFIELVHAMPKQGVTSMFTFGTGWGLVRGVCAGLGLPYELVQPQEWQKCMLVGQPRGSEYLVVSRLWPNAEWRASARCKRPHSGLVDAALICEYGRRRIS
jgi:crossover junction endodeoxyribonuclease RuvC